MSFQSGRFCLVSRAVRVIFGPFENVLKLLASSTVCPTTTSQVTKCEGDQMEDPSVTASIGPLILRPAFRHSNATLKN